MEDLDPILPMTQDDVRQFRQYLRDSNRATWIHLVQQFLTILILAVILIVVIIEAIPPVHHTNQVIQEIHNDLPIVRHILSQVNDTLPLIRGEIIKSGPMLQNVTDEIDLTFPLIREVISKLTD